MPLKLERVDASFHSGYLRICYQDEFGQPRFFEFSKVQTQGDFMRFAQELIQQVNKLLARPRPAEVKAIKRFEEDAARAIQNA